MTDQCREAFEAEFKRRYHVEPNSSDHMKVMAAVEYDMFQAGWNARPGVTVPVEVVEAVKTVRRLRNDAGSADGDVSRIYDALTIAEGIIVEMLLEHFSESALKGGDDAEE